MTRMTRQQYRRPTLIIRNGSTNYNTFMGSQFQFENMCKMKNV